MMFMTDRFIASAMSLVRIAPDAPTRAPEMMRTGLPSTKPAIAAAVPVNEFSRLMTTGMSAPPIGRTIVMPKIRPARTTTPEERRAWPSLLERQGAGRAQDERRPCRGPRRPPGRP